METYNRLFLNSKICIDMRYISELNISFSLEIKGNDKRFRFSPCMNGGSIYVTEDVAEIEALEKSTMYNRVYRRHESCVNEVVGSNENKKNGKKTTKMKEVAEVTNWQDAKEYLVANCEVEEDAVGNPEEILEAAKKCKVTFPNIDK